MSSVRAVTVDHRAHGTHYGLTLARSVQSTLRFAGEQLVEVNDKLTTNNSVTNVKNSITQLSKRFG